MFGIIRGSFFPLHVVGLNCPIFVFADDLSLFTDASKAQTQVVLQILRDLCEASVQMVSIENLLCIVLTLCQLGKGVF